MCHVLIWCLQIFYLECAYQKYRKFRYPELVSGSKYLNFISFRNPETSLSAADQTTPDIKLKAIKVRSRETISCTTRIVTFLSRRLPINTPRKAANTATVNSVT